jgi:hypothetical protein
VELRTLLHLVNRQLQGAAGISAQHVSFVEIAHLSVNNRRTVSALRVGEFCRRQGFSEEIRKNVWSICPEGKGYETGLIGNCNCQQKDVCCVTSDRLFSCSPLLR